MGLLDGLLGGAGVGGAAGGGSPLESLVVSVLSNPNAQHAILGLLGGGQAGSGGGGLQGLISSFEQNGMGGIAQSWVGNGPNQPVSPDQVQTAFGDDKVQAIATQTGMPKQDVLSQLAQMLPGIVDRLTPNGHVPS